MPGFVKTPRDERLWGKAKGIASSGYNVSRKNPRFWKIVTGIFKKMKGISKEGAIPFRMLLKGLWHASFPAGYLWEQKKLQMPGKAWRMYSPMGKAFGKVSNIYNEAFKKEAASISPLMASIIVPLTIGTVAYAVPTAIQKATNAIASRKAFSEVKKQFPDLKKYDSQKLKNQFNVIKQMSPTIAKNPYILGSLLRQTIQYEATDPAFLETLARINQRMEASVVQEFSRGLEPYMKQISESLAKVITTSSQKKKKENQKSLIIS